MERRAAKKEKPVLKIIQTKMTNNFEIENELLRRYRIRLSLGYKNPNPYFVKGTYPTEYQEIKQWIDKLEAKIKNKVE